MNNPMHPLIAALLLVFVSGCMTAKREVSVDIPKGIVAVTESQKALIAWVRDIKTGTSKEQVQVALGVPTDRAKDVWIYRLPESEVYGGNYVTATFTFDGENVLGAKVGYGHETRERAGH